MRAVSLALAITLLVASGLGAQTTVLRCGALVDGVSDAVRRDVAITVVGERIEAVRPFAAAEGNGAVVVDLSDRTCLPGLIDAHAHILIETDDYQVDR